MISTVKMHNVVAVHIRWVSASPSLIYFIDTESRCHVTDSDMATKRWTMTIVCCLLLFIPGHHVSMLPHPHPPCWHTGQLWCDNNNTAQWLQPNNNNTAQWQPNNNMEQQHVPLASCDQHRRHRQACEVHAVGAGLKLVSYARYVSSGFYHAAPLKDSWWVTWRAHDDIPTIMFVVVVFFFFFPICCMKKLEGISKLNGCRF